MLMASLTCLDDKVSDLETKSISTYLQINVALVSKFAQFTVKFVHCFINSMQRSKDIDKHFLSYRQKHVVTTINSTLTHLILEEGNNTK